jgi:hypothetical protein
MRLMLSKTRFQYATICTKRAWLDAHRRELARPPDTASRLRLSDGHRVGAIARELWAGGVLVAEPSARHARAAARTSLLLEDPSVGAVFEGAFAHDGLRIRADVIARSGSSFELIEVKSSPRPREEHLLDLAIQAYVIDGVGVELSNASLVHVNPDYVWNGGRYDPAALFVRVELTEQVFARLPEIHEKKKSFLSLLEAPAAPDMVMGSQCRRHDACPFLDSCRRESGLAPTRSPDPAAVAAAVRVPAAAPGEPLSLLDLQLFSTALPRIVGTSPHERLPFLWSLYVVHPGGPTEHYQELAPFGTDPRAALTDSLAARLPGRGPIVFFSDAVPRAMDALAGRGIASASACLRRLDSHGVDLRARIETTCAGPSDGTDWTWEALTSSGAASSVSARSFASRGEAAAAYVEALDGATPRSRRDAIARKLLEYGRANLAALAGLCGVARVGPRV